LLTADRIVAEKGMSPRKARAKVNSFLSFLQYFVWRLL
jgi:hypothetical protein